MTIEALTQFITLEASDGSFEGRYQNGVTTGPITYDGASYPFLSFIYAGSTKSRTGDNLVSTLALSSNPVSMNIASQAVQQYWSVQVDTVLMHPETFQPVKLLSREHWVATSLTYGPDLAEVELSSAIDAIGADIPNKVLLQSAVGALPLTAGVSNQ